MLSLLAAFAFSGLKSIGSAIVKWLRHRSFWQLVAIGMVVLILVQHFQIAGEKRHSAKVESQLTKCTNARHADQLAYRKAQADAQAKNDGTLARVKHEQEGITDEVTRNLGARLERLRGELLRPSAQSPAGPAHPSPGGNPAAGTADPARLCLAPEELLRAAESEERHDRLIDWIIRQSKVDPNTP